MKKLICTTLLVETSPQGIPLGAACIASAIKNSQLTKGKYNVELVDFSLEEPEIVLARQNGGERAVSSFIAQKIAAEKADFACFSVYVWNRNILTQAAFELKKLLPECVCIAGGPEVTAAPTSFGNAFDFTTAGQGELATVQLLSEIEKGISPKEIPDDISGIYIPENFSENSDSDSENRGENSYSDGKKSSSGGEPTESSKIRRAVPCPVETCPSPYLDGTIDPSKYGGALWELARGCPFKCSYCYESKGEKRIAYFPMERLEKEIELFARKNIPQVFVLDPTYNASKERAIKMLRLIEKKTPGTFYYFEARAEFIDRELARAFSRVNCALQIGLQSANPSVLKNVHRTLDKKLFVKNIGFLNEEGVTFGFDLIYGLPGDDFEGFCESIDFALSLYPNNLELFCLSVLPGTDLHDAASGFGLEWEKNPPYHVLKTPKFSPEDLKKCGKLSNAVNLFYNDGRAVPWLNSVLYPLKEKPSRFFKDFAKWLASPFAHSVVRNDGKDFVRNDCENVEKLQLEFVRKKFHENHLEKFYPAAEDLIKMHGALGRCTFDGSESSFTTNYHPDDVMSEYGTDLIFFAENASRQKCRVKVFQSGNGPDWKVF